MASVNDFDQLISLEDEEFIRTLYQVALRREPDSIGLKSHLAALSAGADKRVLAVATALSQEGRQFNPELAGFPEAIIMFKRERSFPFGPIHRLINLLRRIYRLINRLDSRLANIERSIEYFGATPPSSAGSKVKREAVRGAFTESEPVPPHLTPVAAAIYRRLKSGSLVQRGGMS